MSEQRVVVMGLGNLLWGLNWSVKRMSLREGERIWRL